MNHAALGRQGVDKITGFAGTVTGHIQYLSGCNQLLLVPTVDKDGKLRDGQWFDEQRIELKDEAPIVLDNSKTPGADNSPKPRSY